MSNGDAENPSTHHPPWTIRQVIADVRKFSEYVLIPNHRSGKDKIFIDRLAYRPNNLEDAQTLQELYIHQAQTQFLAQQYTFKEGDRHGQRFTIIIEVKGNLLLTGWILDSNGILKLATPFAGFAT